MDRVDPFAPYRVMSMGPYVKLPRHPLRYSGYAIYVANHEMLIAESEHPRDDIQLLSADVKELCHAIDTIQASGTTDPLSYPQWLVDYIADPHHLIVLPSALQKSTTETELQLIRRAMRPTCFSELSTVNVLQLSKLLFLTQKAITTRSLDVRWTGKVLTDYEAYAY